MTNLTVWKYSLNSKASQLIHMPQGAQVLTVQMQDGSPTIWALVDPAAGLEEHIIEIHGTGHPIVSEEMGRYVGTFQDGWYVGHVFDWTAITHDHQA